MPELQRTTVVTPIGEMLAIASDDGLCALEFTAPGRMTRLDARLARSCAPAVISEVGDGERSLGPPPPSPLDVLRRTRAWLDAYFAGESADASALPLDMRGTAFERRVWDALRQIAPGATSTYGVIARALGDAGAARAVGLANGANPVAIVVPCHRVIGSSGTLVGYGGGLERKQWLLAHEARWRGLLF
jgi:methylated-DNA-[protein]-cysteine S-methyltransferase